MKYVLTSAQAREIDRIMIEKIHIPGILLMEQAAAAVADAVEELCSKSCRVLCICGNGNNGGDGWAAARILKLRGHETAIAATSKKLPPDAEANMKVFIGHSETTWLDSANASEFFSGASERFDVIVDALFGIGLSREPEGLYSDIIGMINESGLPVVSVDIPSGVFCDSGACTVGVNADVTVTFQYAKPAHYLFPGREHTGRLVIAPIGFVREEPVPAGLCFVDHFSLPPRRSNTNKGTYGRLSVIAGSKGMSGAAVMCAKAAVASGAGLTTVHTCGYTADVVQHSVFEAMAVTVGSCFERIKDMDLSELIKNSSALIAGPGLGQHDDLHQLISAICILDIPKVIDADALNMAATVPGIVFGKNTVLTPHPMEFSRISGFSIIQILAEPVKTAASYAKKHGVVVLLKGATTVVSDGSISYLVTAGAPSMAKGGSGDVLSGITGALLAQGLPAIEAAYGAAYIAGKAGEAAAAEKGSCAPTPMDTISHIMP